MAPDPHTVAVLALVALVPVLFYGIETGEFTTTIAAAGVLNVVIIAASLVTMFGGTTVGSGETSVGH